MGMSSSQARLLSLTARQHDVEWRAQKLQADKLKLANDSDRVYNTYLTALNAKKIQTRVYNQWEGDTFKDATLAMLENGSILPGKPGYNENGEYASKPLFLQDVSTGKILITPEYAQSIGVTADDESLTGTLEDFLISKGYTKDKVVTEKVIDHYEENPDVVTSFNAVGNKSVQEFQRDYTFEGAAANATGGIDYDALKNYAKFDESHNASTAGIPVTGQSSFTAGQTYTISNANDLKTLMELSQSGVSTDGVNFVMTQNVSLEGINWTGIENFQGTFNGNGYKITDLTGSQGLFASTDGATIENVGLEDINVNGNSEYIGGLVGYAKDTNIKNAYTTGNVKNTNSTQFTPGTDSSINTGTGGLVGGTWVTAGEKVSYDNVFSSAGVEGNDCVGGLLGSTSMDYGNTVFDLKNFYAIGNVKGDGCVGGVAGHMYYDQDNSNDITDIRNGYAGGNVNGNSQVGGFIGDFVYWGDRGDFCELEGLGSTGKVNGTDSNSEGAFIGTIHVKTPQGGANYIVNIKDSGYANNSGPADGFGGVVDNDGKDIKDEYLNQSGNGGGLVEFQVAAKVPSINADGTGGFYSNIYGALVKAGLFDPAEATEAEKTAIDTQIKAFIQKFADNEEDNEKLYHLNNNLYNYLKGGKDEAFENALISDITNGTTTATAGYQTGAKPDGAIKRSEEDTSWDPTLHETDGKIIIANINTIKQNLKSASKMAGAELTDDQLNAFFAKYDTNNKQDLAYLAELNNQLVAYSQGTQKSIADILDLVRNGNKFQEMPEIIDDLDHYQIIMSGDNEANKVTETHPQQPVYREETHNEWDWEDPKIQQAVAEYNMLQGGFIIIGDGKESTDYDAVDMHLSSEWLTNVIESGLAQFVKYNTETGEVEGTSVANETSLQEVANEAYVKVAEANYEKDMRKINKKETKIDTDLEKLEAERSSIKTEQDDLKKVIDDNVNLTFKLFS